MNLRDIESLENTEISESDSHERRRLIASEMLQEVLKTKNIFLFCSTETIEVIDEMSRNSHIDDLFI